MSILKMDLKYLHFLLLRIGWRAVNLCSGTIKMLVPELSLITTIDNKPWKRIHIDYAGPFQGHLLLVVVDSHSKWLEVVPVSFPTTMKTVAVGSDNGPS